MQKTAMTEVLEQLRALIQAAHNGSIIPVRLPGQLEEIESLIVEATNESETPHSPEPDTENLSGTDQQIIDNAQFFKTAIHELRTPMTSIRGYSDMLNNEEMSGELTDMQRQLLDVIRSNSRRMESLLSDMSYLNRIRSGILKTSIKMDMFKNIAMMIEKESRPIAEELNRQLVLEIPQGLPLLNTDGELMSHALVKLVENGLRYSPEGDGVVNIQAQGEDGILTIFIDDNGIGMTEEELSRLGEVYFRADHDLVRNYKGSGLGVAIAYGIFDLLDARIAVESEPDQGTRFTIQIQGMQ